MALLQYMTGAEQGKQLELKQDKTVLGRNPDCHVVISGTAVSRAHAHILRIQDKFFIEDIKSRNGTFVNNEPIAGRTQLKNNDRIKICDFICAFFEAPPDQPADQPQPDDAENDELETTGTIEATVSHSSSKQILDAQPAEKLKALLEITGNLSKTLELDPLLPKIVESLFTLFRQADRCFIILRDETGKKLIPKIIKTRRPTDEMNARFSRSIVNKCVDDVEAILSEDASSDSRFAMSQSIADFRLRSVMCAPLWMQDGKGFGIIQLDTQDRSKRFTQDDLKLLMGVASQASIALENAKMHQDLVARERMKRDMELAREVQRSFLPLKPPQVPGYEFFAHYEAAYEVGGDYYDFIELPDKRVAVMLGDVAGKGVPAALLMAKISADARFCMLTKPNPAQAITELNALMNRSGLADRFVTLAAAVLDYNKNTVTLVNAGHPSPVIYHQKTRLLEEATANEVTGLPIGILDGYEYTSCEVKLEPGDTVFIFSDGVTEAMDVNNNQLQMKGIYAALEGLNLTTQALGEKLVKTVKQHAAGRSQHDDLTLVAFGRQGGTP